LADTFSRTTAVVYTKQMAQMFLAGSDRVLLLLSGSEIQYEQHER